MMYGFGDVENPRMDSAELIEELTMDYISSIVGRAVATSTVANIASGISANAPPRLRVEDLMHAIRDDAKKLSRVEELLFMTEELKRVRKAYDVEDDSVGGSAAASRLLGM